MKGVLVARLDNMSGDNGADGPRRSRQAPLLVAPGDDLGDSGEYEAGHGVLGVLLALLLLLSHLQLHLRLQRVVDLSHL